MGAAAQMVVAASKLLARLHQWYGAAFVLSQLPLAALDETSVGRLRYALMMANRSRPERTQRLLHAMMRRNEPVSSPELGIELAAMATAVNLPHLADDLLLHAQQMAMNPHTADAAGRLLHLNRADADGTLRGALQEKIDALALPVANLLTIVPVSGKYLELWKLWLGQVRRHVGGLVVAMAMDDAALSALSGQQDVAVVDVREFFSWDARGKLHPHTRGVLWYLRVLLLREFVQRGHTVLVLDLDAIPVGDVKAMLSTLPPADVVAQQDHSIPMDVDRQLGFVLCCGFMLWRPTGAARALLDRFAAETAIERDDQLALNHLLQSAGLKGQAADSSHLRFEAAGTSFICPNVKLVSRSLDRGSVIRHFHQTGLSLVELQASLGIEAEPL